MKYDIIRTNPVEMECNKGSCFTAQAVRFLQTRCSYPCPKYPQSTCFSRKLVDLKSSNEQSALGFSHVFGVLFLGPRLFLTRIVGVDGKFNRNPHFPSMAQWNCCIPPFRGPQTPLTTIHYGWKSTT